MIEINLISQKKKFKLPIVLGIDLNHLNLKMFVVVFMLSYIPTLIIYPMWEADLSALDGRIKILDKKFKKVNKQVREKSHIKKQLKAYQDQVNKLKQRSKQVEAILKTKTNPRSVLERVARITPNDVWLRSIKIKSDKSILINGYSETYKSIGDYIISGNETPYFGKSLSLDKSNTIEQNLDGDKFRIEEFSIKGSIQTFNTLGN